MGAERRLWRRQSATRRDQHRSKAGQRSRLQGQQPDDGDRSMERRRQDPAHPRPRRPRQCSRVQVRGRRDHKLVHVPRPARGRQLGRWWRRLQQRSTSDRQRAVGRGIAYAERQGTFTGLCSQQPPLYQGDAAELGRSRAGREQDIDCGLHLPGKTSHRAACRRRDVEHTVAAESEHL